MKCTSKERLDKQRTIKIDLFVDFLKLVLSKFLFFFVHLFNFLFKFRQLGRIGLDFGLNDISISEQRYR